MPIDLHLGDDRSELGTPLVHDGHVFVPVESGSVGSRSAEVVVVAVADGHIEATLPVLL